ncbi:MAG: hypothetical protein HWN68_17465 [Desulfobacterales bacterium]|nr:hypothetical protein [Desulfobacterales bacterium]
MRSECIRRYVGLEPKVDRIIQNLANSETKGKVGPMIAVLIEEALRTREKSGSSRKR